MDTSFVNVFLLIVGIGVLVHRDTIANRVAAERWLLEFGLARNEERRTCSGAMLIAGLALVFTGLLRFVA